MSTPSRREYWDQRLVSCAEQPDASSSRALWLGRAYARIYRFMLSQYGSDEALPEYAPGSADQLPTVIDSATPPSGVHSLGELRSTLKSIRHAVPQMPLGALSTGVNPHDWITLAYDSEQLDVSRCRRCLARDGFDCRAFKQAGLMVLQVRVRDFGKAHRWLDDHRERFRPPVRSYRLSVALFAMCFLLSLPALATALASWQRDRFDANAPLAIVNAGVALVGLLTLMLIVYVRRYPLRP